MPAIVHAAFIVNTLLIATLVLIAWREHRRARTLNGLNIELVAARDRAERLAMRASRLQALATALSVVKSPEYVANNRTRSRSRCYRGFAGYLAG
jgi:hypothetical protein